ncbi:hypothetical protein GDO86_004487 [Hymenochirus boettgeri]|uniref:Uncharacterized protein n=1 Tax=Hymenochirus boettgeri TaxID=247094 RepID=A0A8T2K8I1_9PIPI|nr:hypothetical protein GDO86_004487 [Hymenochirus boettgeri]
MTGRSTEVLAKGHKTVTCHYSSEKKPCMSLPGDDTWKSPQQRG